MNAHLPIPRHPASSMELITHGSCPREFSFCNGAQPTRERPKKHELPFFGGEQNANVTYPIPACVTRRHLRLSPHPKGARTKHGQRENRHGRPELFRVHDGEGLGQGRRRGDAPRGDKAGKRQDPFVRGRSDTDIYLRTSRERKNRNALDEADGVTGTGCRLVQGEECLLPFMIRRLSQETRFPSAITTFWSSQPKEWAGIIFTEDMTKQKISPKLRDQSLRGIYRLGSSCDHLPLVGPSKRCRERRQCMCTPPHVGDSRNRLEPVVISENHGEIHVLFNSSGKRRKEKKRRGTFWRTIRRSHVTPEVEISGMWISRVWASRFGVSSVGVSCRHRRLHFYLLRLIYLDPEHLIHLDPVHPLRMLRSDSACPIRPASVRLVRLTPAHLVLL